MKPQITGRHTRPLAEVSLICDGVDRSLLITAAHDQIPQIRNGITGELLLSLKGHRGAVWSAKIDPYTRTFAATASGDFTAKLWCVQSGSELHEFKHNHVVKSIDFSMDSLNIATGSQDGKLRIFDTCDPDKQPIIYQSSSLIASTSSIVALTTPPIVDGINKVLYSNLEKHIISVGKKSGIVEKWDLRVNNQIKPITTLNISNGGDSIIDIDQNTNHKILMIASKNKVYAYTSDTYELINQYEMPSPMSFQEEGGVSLHPNGRKFIAGGSDVWLREFDLTSGELIRIFKGHHGPIRCVRYHPSGITAVSGSTDATIRFWDLIDS